MGVDYSEKYLNFSQKKWKNFKFLKLDLNQKESIKEFKNFQPNFIFVNGAIHHLDDGSVSRINNFVAEFEKSLFLSVDPISDNNKILNKLMIKFDRGKYIRTRKEYENLMTNYNNFIIDDFYKMSFKNVFHYKNFDLVSANGDIIVYVIGTLYGEWLDGTVFSNIRFIDRLFTSWSVSAYHTAIFTYFRF